MPHNISVDPATVPSITNVAPRGEVAPDQAMWTVTFDKEVTLIAINIENVYVSDTGFLSQSCFDVKQHVSSFLLIRVYSSLHC